MPQEPRHSFCCHCVNNSRLRKISDDPGVFSPEREERPTLLLELPLKSAASIGRCWSGGSQANTRRDSAGLMLGHHRIRWSSTKTTYM